MRRLAAHLVLAAIYAGFFSPLLIAQEPTLHACCLRNGAHHCQGTSSEEAGFHAKRTACPYTAQLPPTGAFGLEPAKFTGGSTTIGELISPADSDFRSLIFDRQLSARAPPDSLL